jgi:hypothetical protein
MIRIRTLLIVSLAHLTRSDERALTRDGYRRGEYGWLLPMEHGWPIPDQVPPQRGFGRSHHLCPTSRMRLSAL